MTNEYLWVALLLLTFIGIMGAYKLFGRTGLYAWVAVAVILANIQVLKTIELFGFVVTLGNIMYSTSFLVTDILNEKYGRKEAEKAVWLGFYVLFAMTAIMQVCLWFVPDISDFAHPSLLTLFGIMPRIALASATAYLLSQLHDVWAFDFWRKRFGKSSQLWIRNNASTMVSQLIDSSIFCTIAFLGLFPMEVFWSIFWTSYFLKWIVAACDTPFVYWAVRMIPWGEGKEQ